MLTHNNQESFILLKGSLHHEQHKQLYNPYWKKMPEIISFTQFLRWNYTIDYGQYIRHLHYNGQLPLSWGILPHSDITNVTILEGKYDRIDEFSFNMHVICNVTFFSNGYEQQQCYCVNGYYSITGKSNFLCSVDIYNGKHIRRINPLDEFLVPILSKKKYDREAERILKKYYPLEYDLPCVINGTVIAKEMGYSIQYERLSLNEKIKSKLIFEPKNVTVYDNYGTRTIEINNEIGTVIIKMNHDEHNTIRKETRRHISLEAYDLSRDRFQTTDGTPEDILCHKEELYALYRAISTLNEKQKRLIYRVFWLNESQYDIAREEGVSRVAIHNRLQKIFKKMKKILENEG